MFCVVVVFVSRLANCCLRCIVLTDMFLKLISTELNVFVIATFAGAAFHILYIHFIWCLRFSVFVKRNDFECDAAQQYN